MKFAETKIKGSFIITLDLIEDERGFFTRAFCRHEFEDHGLNSNFVQCNISYNKKKGTLRGMHYQTPPHAEVKLVRCISGAIYDVIVDLRPESSTFKQWYAAKLTKENHQMLYIPEGCAHGYQALEDNIEVFYQVSSFYHPVNERGVRWNDPSFGIVWPLTPIMLSKKDSSYSDWKG